MPVFRLILVLVILGGFALFTLQNATPAIALVFLGRQTLALPLSLWILGAISSGAVTTLLFTGLLRLSNTVALRKARSRGVNPSRVEPDPTSPKSSWQSTTSSTSSQSSYSQSNYAGSTSDYPSDDQDEDFGDESAAEPADRAGYAQDYGRDRTDYEVPQEPTTGYRSGSVYSYSYRDSNTSGAGRAESVYDAEYRVIIPPQPPTSDTMDDDDYGFEDEDEFEEFEDDTPAKPQPRQPDRRNDSDWGDQSWRDKGWGESPRSDW